MNHIAEKHLLASLALSLLLGGCGGDSDDNDNVQADDATGPALYEISMVNLTAAQPLSPPSVVAHSDGYSLFVLGEPATEGLERVAEAGDNQLLLSEASSSDAVLAAMSAGDVLPPGGSTALSLEVDGSLSGLKMSVVTMLVNTNDAFAAVNGVAIGELAVGENVRLTAIAYDAGTEANDERAGTIPGPADGGAGFEPARDDSSDAVLMHSGVLTADDGLGSSVLTEVHRWDNPVARVTITRMR